MFSYDVKFRHVGSGGGGAEHTHLLSKGVLPLERTPAALALALSQPAETLPTGDDITDRR
jgi:hypothetical protein